MLYVSPVDSADGSRHSSVCGYFLAQHLYAGSDLCLLGVVCDEIGSLWRVRKHMMHYWVLVSYIVTSTLAPP